jgi:hypothetical protein
VSIHQANLDDKKNELHQVLPEVGDMKPDPFDLDSMVLDQSYLEKVGVTKLLTTITVGKPKSQSFIRVHPDPE